jgi:hypothetical protein
MDIRSEIPLSEALTDPIVQAVMAADRVDAHRLVAIMRRKAARLATRALSARRN